MECKKCKKQCMESELTDGYCQECVSKFKNNPLELHKIRNDIAHYFKIWTILEIIAGIIFGIFFIFEYNILIGFTIMCSSIVLAILLRAISEIIQLLEDIKNK